MAAAIKGKVALITGGASGIGYYYAASLMQNGIKGIVLADTNEKLGKKAACDLGDLGDGQVHFIATDVTVEQQLKNAFDAVVEKFNQLDIAINNAGVIKECTWTKMVQINFIAALRGTYMAMKYYLPKYRKFEESIIVNTASVVGIQPLQCLPVYSTTKQGLVGLSRSLGTDYYYKKYQSKLLTICPGLTETPLIELGNLSGVDLDFFEEECNDWTRQSAKQCGICLVHAITAGENGSIWVTEGDEIYEYPFPDRFQVQKQILGK